MKHLLLIVILFLNIYSVSAQQTDHEKASFAYVNGNLKGAREYAMRIILKKPKDCYANYIMGAVCKDENKLDSALYYAENSILYLKKSVFANAMAPFELRSECYFMLSRFDEALADMNLIIKQSKSTPMLYNRALIFSKMKRYEESDKDLKVLISARSNQSSAYHMLAQNALAVNSYSLAKEYIEKGEKIRTKEKQEWLPLLIRTYVGLNDTINTLKCFDDLLSKDKNVDEELVVYAFPLVGKQLMSKSEHNLESGEGIRVSLMLRMFLLKCMNDLDAAITDLYALDAYATDAYEKFYFSYNRAFLYNELGSYADALIDVNESLKYIQQPLAYRLRANIHYHTMKYDEAIADAKKAVELDSASLSNRFTLLHMYTNMGETEKARSALSVLYSKNQEDRTLLFKLAEMNRQLNDRTASDPLYKLLLEKDTIANDISFRHHALYHLGMKEEAFQWIEKMEESMSKQQRDKNRQAVFAYNLACFYVMTGDMDKGYEYLSDALKKGFVHIYAIENDIDFKPLKNDPRFIELINTYKKNFNPDKLDGRRPRLRS